jgi:hypothetical protein
MVTKEHADKLARAIESAGLAEVVSATHSDNRISVMCRVSSGKEDKWVQMVRSILIASLDEAKEVHAWQTHICRNYFIKENEETGDRKLVWGWNVSIHSKEMGLSLSMVTKLVHGEPIRVVNNRELKEFPLHGAPVDRNAPKKGKGVQTIGNSDFHPGRTK